MRSKNYMFTYIPGNAESDVEMLQLKEYVKFMLEEFNVRLRIVKAGRLGKNNPNAWKYRSASRYYKGCGGHPYQYIKKSDAVKFDVYVYNY